MSNKIVFAISALGLAAGMLVAYNMSGQPKAAPPLYQPSANPYASGIYSEGIIESRQGSGENLNLFPDVSGSVTHVWVHEGDHVQAGQPLLEIDKRVQEATTDQLRLQAQAARDTLAELKAQPRKESLDVAAAQFTQAQATQRTLERQYAKLAEAQRRDPGAVSQDSVDTAQDQLKAAQAATAVAQRQLDLTRAGAWSRDIQTQSSQLQALEHAYDSAKALLDKYTLRAPSEGTVMALHAAEGGWISSAGVYGTYTEAQGPVAVLSRGRGELAVRCFVDEILIPRLPKGHALHAQLSVRGSDLKVPLEFDRVQPYVSPKIELSDAREERVDLRVLPVIFHFRPPAGVQLYAGELVDVYIETDPETRSSPATASAPH